MQHCDKLVCRRAATPMILGIDVKYGVIALLNHLNVTQQTSIIDKLHALLNDHFTKSQLIEFVTHLLSQD